MKSGSGSFILPSMVGLLCGICILVVGRVVKFARGYCREDLGAVKRFRSRFHFVGLAQMRRNSAL